MWLLRRKARTPEAEAEILPPATGPMRRIEITVERQWISKIPDDSMPEATGPQPSGTAAKQKEKLT